MSILGVMTASYEHDAVQLVAGVRHAWRGRAAYAQCNAGRRPITTTHMPLNFHTGELIARTDMHSLPLCCNDCNGSDAVQQEGGLHSPAFECSAWKRGSRVRAWKRWQQHARRFVRGNMPRETPRQHGWLSGCGGCTAGGCRAAAIHTASQAGAEPQPARAPSSSPHPCHWFMLSVLHEAFIKNRSRCALGAKVVGRRLRGRAHGGRRQRRVAPLVGHPAALRPAPHSLLFL